MITYMLAYLRGWLWIRITGDDIERFLNLCIQNGIVMEELRREEGAVYAKLCGISCFYQMYPYIRKTKVSVRITRKQGLLFWIQRNKGRYGYILGVILMFMMLNFFQTMIWEIHFEGNTVYQDEALLAILEENGYSVGMKKADIVCDHIESIIRNSCNDVTWVSVEIRGVRMLVSLNESEILKGEMEEETPGSIISDVDGKIVSIITRTGTPLVHVGDEVASGDILVSGVIALKNDAAEVTGYHYTEADADIIVEYEIQYEEQVPATYVVRDYASEKHFSYIQLFGYRFSTDCSPALNRIKNVFHISTGSSSRQTEYYETSHQLVILRGYPLDIYWGEITRKTYTERVEYYTEEQELELAQNNLQQYIEDLSNLGVQIIENNVTMNSDGNSVLMKGSLVCQHKVDSTCPIQEDSLWQEGNIEGNIIE